jgi:hypothetical protein
MRAIGIGRIDGAMDLAFCKGASQEVARVNRNTYSDSRSCLVIVRTLSGSAVSHKALPQVAVAPLGAQSTSWIDKVFDHVGL